MYIYIYVYSLYTYIHTYISTIKQRTQLYQYLRITHYGIQNQLMLVPQQVKGQTDYYKTAELH